MARKGGPSTELSPVPQLKKPKPGRQRAFRVTSLIAAYTLRLPEPSGQPQLARHLRPLSHRRRHPESGQAPERRCGSAQEKDLLYRKPDSRLYSTRFFSGPVKPRNKISPERNGQRAAGYFITNHFVTEPRRSASRTRVFETRNNFLPFLEGPSQFATPIQQEAARPSCPASTYRTKLPTPSIWKKPQPGRCPPNWNWPPSC